LAAELLDSFVSVITPAESTVTVTVNGGRVPGVVYFTVACELAATVATFTVSSNPVD